MVHVTKGKGMDHFSDRIGLLAFMSREFPDTSFFYQNKNGVPG